MFITQNSTQGVRKTHNMNITNIVLIVRNPYFDCKANRCQKDSNTEFLIVGSKQQLERVNIPFIHVDEDQITPVASVRNLGVVSDSNLKMDMQITKACQNAYYHLHNIRRIRKFLSQEATCTIIHAFITSQMDYCNSLMNGLPENLIKKLQRVQDTAARLVFNPRKYDRTTPTLVTLQWLPVKYRTEFKTLLIVFKGLHKQRVLMHRHQGWNVRHGLCHIYMRYLYIYELFIAFVCFVVCSLL